MKSMAESRSSMAREHRTPSTPACLRISAAAWPVIARLSGERLSRHRPCSAKEIAFSGDTTEGGVVEFLASCAAPIEPYQRHATKKTIATTFLGNLHI